MPIATPEVYAQMLDTAKQQGFLGNSDTLLASKQRTLLQAISGRCLRLSIALILPAKQPNHAGERSALAFVQQPPPRLDVPGFARAIHAHATRHTPSADQMPADPC